MLEIERLTEHDLECFKNKKVLVYVAGDRAIQLCKIFKHFEIEVLVCYVGHSNITIDILALKILGVKIIHSEKIYEFLKNKNNIIVQSTMIEPIGNAKAINFAKSINAEFSKLPFGHISMSFSHLIIFEEFKNNFKYFRNNLIWKYMRKKKQSVPIKILKEKNFNSPIFICTPPKTGIIR